MIEMKKIVSALIVILLLCISLTSCGLTVKGLPVPCIKIDDYTEEGFRIIYDAESVEEICGAKIISYEYEEPVKNDFRLL